jgi:hypothetical protein
VNNDGVLEFEEYKAALNMANIQSMQVRVLREQPGVAQLANVTTGERAQPVLCVLCCALTALSLLRSALCHLSRTLNSQTPNNPNNRLNTLTAGLGTPTSGLGIHTRKP